MSIEDRALSAFKEANPIPDPESLEIDRLPGYLADVQLRSTEMTGTDQRQRETRPARRQRRVVAVTAAALTVVGIVVIGILASSGGDQSPDVVNPTPPTVVTQTTAEAVVTPTEVTPETILGLWGRVPAGVMEIRADGFVRIVAVGNQDLELSDELLDQAGSHTSGSWDLEGDTLTFTSDGTGTLCDAGATATMTLSFQGTHLVISDVVDDPCGSPGIFNGFGRFPGNWLYVGDPFAG